MRDIDLRAAVERTSYQRVFDQGRTNQCGGFGGHKTPHECMRELAGMPYRPISAVWAYNRALEMTGQLGQDPGSGKLELARVAEIGWVYEDQYEDTSVRPSSLDSLARKNSGLRVRAARELPGKNKNHAISRSLEYGLPVVVCIPVSEGFWSGISKGPWTTHDFTPTETRNTHWATVVGKSEAHRVYLSEDSSGPGAWDGGFFGIPMHLVDEGFIQDAWRIDYIPGGWLDPQAPKEVAADLLTKVDVGRWFDANRYQLASEVVTAYLNGATVAMWSTALQAFDRVRPLLMRAGTAALETSGIEGLLAWCRANGLTDLMLEVLAGWPRATVRRYFDAQGLPPDLIDWAPL